MPLVIPSSVLVRLIWASNGLPYAVNVYAGQKVGGAVVSQAVADTLGAAIKSALAASSLDDQVGTTISLQNVGLRDISAPNQPEYMDSGAAVSGTGAGNLLPPQVAVCVTLRTALAGKSFRGRSYLTGFTVGAVTATGTALPAVTTACQSFVDGVRVAMSGSSFTLAVASRKSSVVNAVTLIQVRDSIFDTQRRRAIPGI